MNLAATTHLLCHEEFALLLQQAHFPLQLPVGSLCTVFELRKRFIRFLPQLALAPRLLLQAPVFPLQRSDRLPEQVAHLLPAVLASSIGPRRLF
jgi:hypothetical protein